MYPELLHAHSLLRFFVLAALTVVIVMAMTGIAGKRPFGKWDNKISLYLVIFTHLQFLVGLILYFVSPNVKFGRETMGSDSLRYWTVEHIFGMVIAIALITIGRSTSKKIPTDLGKHYRLLIFNGVALIIIVGVIVMSGRKLFGISTF